MLFRQPHFRRHALRRPLNTCCAYHKDTHPKDNDQTVWAMTSPLPNTLRNVVHAFTEFLVVATHTILYERDIYPRTSFNTARKYNIAVRQSRHPKVCEWITDAVASVEAQLLKAVVDRVAIVIYSKSHDALERFVFDMSRLPDVAEADLDVPMIRQAVSDDEAEQSLLPTVDMDEQFRAIMYKIANCGSTLQPLPKHCTFTIAIELRNDERPHAPLSHPQAWVPANPAQDVSSDSSQHSGQQEPKTTPIRTMRAGELAFEAWVEESATKATLATAQSVSSSSEFNSKIPSAEG